MAQVLQIAVTVLGDYVDVPNQSSAGFADQFIRLHVDRLNFRGPRLGFTHKSFVLLQRSRTNT